jgi:hypothetical protein
MITINAKANFSEALKRLKTLQNSVQVMEKAFTRAGDAIVQSTKMGYEKQKDPTGKPWAPLDPSNKKYLYRPDRYGIVQPPNNPVTNQSKALVNHGAMRTSLTFKFSKPQNLVRIGYGTKEQAEKAFKHQFGITGEMKVAGKRGIRKVRITPTPRKNLGFATWARLGTFGLNDQDLVVKIFLETIDEAIREVYG